MAEVMHKDCHPVEVYVPESGHAPWRPARVFVTSEWVIVWEAKVAAPLQGWHTPEKVWIGRLADEPPQRNRGTCQGFSVKTEAGTVHVNMMNGCGCGSPLKALSAPVSW